VCDFTMLRSSTGFTVVGSELVLLAGLESVTGLDTVAVLVTDGAAVAPTPTVKVIVLDPPDASPLAAVHVTTWPDAEHDQPAPVPETNDSPAGSVSLTVMTPDGDGPALATTSEYTPLVPTEKLPEWLLTMLRSSTGLTVVGSDDVLLAGFESVTGLETVAVLVTDGAAAAATPTVKVIVLDPADASPPAAVHVITWPDAEHDQPAPVPETNDRPAGSVSLTVMTPDGDGPALATTSEYRPLFPTAKLPVWLLTMLRSSSGITVVGSLLVLLLGFGSVVGLDTDAELVTLGAAAGATATVSVMVLPPPFAMALGLVHVTVWPLAEQLHPVPVPETKERPVGSVSVTVIGPAAEAGPALAMARE
jgi:hypothetical protein